MNKKTMKIVSIILMAIMIVSISASVFATDSLTPPNQISRQSVSGVTQINLVAGRIITVLQAVGIVLSIIVLIVIGIKYMLGSAEEKSEYKKTLLPYVIGAALIFAASIFANVIYEFFTSVGTSTSVQ